MKIIEGFASEKKLFDKLYARVQESGCDETNPAMSVSLEILAHFELGTLDDLSQIKTKRVELRKLVHKLGKMGDVKDTTAIPRR